MTAEEVREVTEHPALDLVNRPNEFMGGFELRMGTSVYEDLTGKGYWYAPHTASNPPASIWLLPSQWVTPVYAKGGIDHYLFGANKGDRKKIPPKDMIHFRFFNPMNILDGYAPLQGAIYAQALGTAMDIYEAALNKNLGTIGNVLSYKEKLTKEETKTLQIAVNQVFGGVAQAGKTMVTGGDAKLSPIGASPREMAMLRGREYSRDQICNAFGVPLQFVKTDNVSRANLEGAIFLYQAQTIAPRLRLIEDVLNYQLVPMFDKPMLTDPNFTLSNKVFFAFDNVIPRDEEFELKEDTELVRSTISTPAEIRKRRNLEERPEADVLLVDSGKTVLGSATSDPDKPPQNDAEGGPGKGLHASPGAITKQVDRERTGGPNPELTKAEEEMQAILNELHRDEGMEVAKQATSDVPLKPEPFLDKYMPLLLPVLVGVADREADIAFAAAKTPRADLLPFRRIEEFITPDVAKFIKNDVANIGGDFIDSLQDGLFRGEDLRALGKRVEDVLKSTEHAKRAAQTARTEVQRAQTRATIEAWKSTGVVVAKEWDALNDACPFCLDMDGEVVGLTENYWQEGQVQEVAHGDPNEDGSPHVIKLDHAYANVDGPPLHPNCRCGLRAVFIEPQ
jgi:HK97 family phage portal protein